MAERCATTIVIDAASVEDKKRVRTNAYVDRTADRSDYDDRIDHLK